MLTKMIVLMLSFQFTVSVEKTAFTVSVDENPVYEVEEKQRQVYLAFFTASYCGPCQGWKRDVMPQVEAAGHHVKLIEMTDAAKQERYGSRITSFPAFVVCDWDTGTWLTEPVFGGIDLATAKRMLVGSESKPKDKAASPPPRVMPPVRYIQWPGWGTIDLETYSRDCSCGMCNSIRQMQAEYWRQLKAFQRSQSQVTPDQEGCPHALVETMLDEMRLRRDDVLGELGCGDARILIAAARRGIRGIGIELDPVRAAVGRRNVEAAGLERMVTIETGDAMEFDVGRVTVATAYLYPPLLAKLAPRLKGLRVVASPYHEVPGLSMRKAGDVWIHQTGG